MKVKRITFCRLCRSTDLVPVLNFGKTPPANSFLKKSQLQQKEDFFPLVVNFCQNCGQLQLSHVVNPELLFRHYVWVSSTSKVTVAHFHEYALSVFRDLKMKQGDLVVEIGSNDGVLLKPLKTLGAKVLGVDPARNVAARATRAGIPTLPYFFSSEIAKKIVKKYGKATLIAANNVFAHIHDLGEVVEAVKVLLQDSGVFVVEAPYTIDFLEKNLFDIVYHEHLSYLAIKPLQSFFKKFGLEIFDVVRSDVHGGSVRIFVKRMEAPYLEHSAVQKFIQREKEKGLYDLRTYKLFSKQIKKNKHDLIKLLFMLKGEKKSIAGYGAPAKSTTLLHYFEINKGILDFIVDDSPYKVGLFTPGTHIPVVATSELYRRSPDYVLILAWNFAESIMKMHKKYTELGGKFIIPVPHPRLT